MTVATAGRAGQAHTNGKKAVPATEKTTTPAATKGIHHIVSGRKALPTAKSSHNTPAKPLKPASAVKQPSKSHIDLKEKSSSSKAKTGGGKITPPSKISATKNTKSKMQSAITKEELTEDAERIHHSSSTKPSTSKILTEPKTASSKSTSKTSAPPQPSAPSIPIPSSAAALKSSSDPTVPPGTTLKLSNSNIKGNDDLINPSKGGRKTTATEIKKSLIPRPKGKKIGFTTNNTMSRLEKSLQQIRNFKVRFRAELANQTKYRQPVSKIDVFDLEEEGIEDGLDFKDEKFIKEQFKDMYVKNRNYQKQVADLEKSLGGLQNRLLKEQEKGRLAVNPTVTLNIPTSLEANMHLRYQYEQNIDKERKKYAGLLAENERLSLEVKNDEFSQVKRSKQQKEEIQKQYKNEIATLKGRIKEIQFDNIQLVELLGKREQSLAQLVKERDGMAKELVTKRRVNMHLSNKIGNVSEEDISKQAPPKPAVVQEEESSTQIVTEKELDSIETPSYAKKLKKKTEVKLRPGVAALLNAGKNQNDIVNKENGEEKENVDMAPSSAPNDSIRSAKIQLEFKAYVNNDGKGDELIK